ncbi:phytanoyl-CoA dioxygenase [Colletotrichum cuscutae]|uniref:Phytanoyl-CoA dioxygenase n=1 Tax=Colletotrichum cuscutae TaxID=1209917 RepID=A0AAI9Y6L8_9PEZI|nr:phytanoyl-CoA dioxygenase [Colletotrichum cuscutae]
MVALDDFTPTNGATVIIPGSHTWGPDTDTAHLPQRKDAIPVVMDKGSVVFFLGTLWHGGGENTSPDPPEGADDPVLPALDAAPREPDPRRGVGQVGRDAEAAGGLARVRAWSPVCRVRGWGSPVEGCPEEAEGAREKCRQAGQVVNGFRPCVWSRAVSLSK